MSFEFNKIYLPSGKGGELVGFIGEDGVESVLDFEFFEDGAETALLFVNGVCIMGGGQGIDR